MGTTLEVSLAIDKQTRTDPQEARFKGWAHRRQIDMYKKKSFHLDIFFLLQR